jgi:hypothetical protein
MFARTVLSLQKAKQTAGVRRPAKLRRLLRKRKENRLVKACLYESIFLMGREVNIVTMGRKNWKFLI